MNLAIWTRFAKSLALGRMPNYLIAFVNGRCNMKCDFCCDAAISIRKAPEMSPAQWGKAVSGADGLLHVTITGGEPFLRKDLTDVILAMRESCGVRRISINTNGSLTDRIEPVLSSLLRSSNFDELRLSISLDGHEQVHDAVRNSPGSYASAMETIKAVNPLREAFPSFTLRVASVLQPGNESDLENFLDDTESWDVDFHEVILLRDVPIEVQRGLADTYARLTARQLDRASARFRGKVDWRIERRLRRDILDHVHGRKNRTKCLAGGRLVEVLSDGVVRGCEIGKMWDHSIIGNVGDVSGGARLVDIVKAQEAKEFREKARACTCTFECANMCSGLFQPTTWAKYV
jgi:MoaA/NifB/PqqE/SkfB family radical SAM enzyme